MLAGVAAAVFAGVMGGRVGAVIGVLGGCGGVGASSFAAALAVLAAPSLLIDLDVAAGGIDVLLGMEQASGARWSGLQLAGGRLDPDDLIAGLPHVTRGRGGRSRAGPCAVLAADTGEIDPDAVVQVIDAARPVATVVLDLPRHAGAARTAALAHCDLLVLLARADVAGLVAAHTCVAGLGEWSDVPLGMVLRRGEVAPADAASSVGVRLLGVLPAARPGGRPERPSRDAGRVARGVLAGLAAQPARVPATPGGVA